MKSAGILIVKTFKEWIEREGSQGRRRLFEGIKAKYLGITQIRLTNYLQGQWVPDYDIANIIAQVTCIPIFLLLFRFITQTREPQS